MSQSSSSPFQPLVSRLAQYQLPPPLPEDDADHFDPHPNFFEWWYFDVHFEDGGHLVVIFHSKLFTVFAHLPTVDLRYYPPDGGPAVIQYGNHPPSTYWAAKDRCAVNINGSVIEDRGDYYYLKAAEGELAVELRFTPQIKGWKVGGTSHIYLDETNGNYFDWVVPIPRATVQGTLMVRGQTQTVQGIGYHDHNWGNAYLGQMFDHWTWGRILGQDWTLIFCDLVGRGKQDPGLTLLLFAWQDEPPIVTEQVNYWGEGLQKHKIGVNYYRQLNLESLRGVKIKLNLVANRLIDKANFASLRLPLVAHPFSRKIGDTAYYLTMDKPVIGPLTAALVGKGGYLRWEAACSLQIEEKNAVQTGTALYEIMRL